MVLYWDHVLQALANGNKIDEQLRGGGVFHCKTTMVPKVLQRTAGVVYTKFILIFDLDIKLNITN